MVLFCCCDPLLGPETDEDVRKEILGRDGAPRKRRSNKVVTVTVPEGMYEGSPIAVMSPDGRAMDAVVPQGVYPGETFLVTFPPPESEPEMRIETQYIPSRASQEEQATIETKSESKPEMTLPSFVEKLDALLTPVPDPPVLSQPPTPVNRSLAPSPSKRMNTPGTEVEAREDDLDVEHSKSFTSVMSDVVEKILLPDLDAACSPQQSVEEEPAAVVEEREEHNPGSPPSSQKYLRVHVPRGMRPGSSMQVEVPGENRTLNVLVPDGFSSFHVAYTPQTEQDVSLLAEVRPPTTNSKAGTLQRMGKKTAPPRQDRRDDAASPPPQAHSRIVSRAAPIGQKLLLVRVPPGTSPGTTLHVSVPDEPGRILAAVVPPGNVREFHVAYEARAPNPVDNQKSFMRPASPYHEHQPNVGPSRTYPDSGQRHAYQNNRGGPFFDPANPYQGGSPSPYERSSVGAGYMTSQSPVSPYNYGTPGAAPDNYGMSPQSMNHSGYVVTSSAPRPGSAPVHQYQQYVQQRGPYPPNSSPYGSGGNGDYYNPSYNNNRHLQHHYANHPGGSGVDYGDDF